MTTMTRAVLAALVLLVAGGCATPPADNIVTAGEDSDARKRARIRMELAVGYFEQGKTEIALEELRQVVAIDPSYPDAYNLRGLIAMRLNNMPLAEDSFRRAVAVNPRDADTQHNLGWLLCQTGRYADAQRSFDVALASATYAGRSKTLMAQGICQVRAGQHADAERTLARAYELDPGNPVTGFNLANLLYRRGDNERAQFYIRRLNNSEFANAETLWLGIKVERRLNDMVALRQLGDQLKRRFGASREATAYERGTFDE